MEEAFGWPAHILFLIYDGHGRLPLLPHVRLKRVDALISIVLVDAVMIAG